MNHYLNGNRSKKSVSGHHSGDMKRAKSITAWDFNGNNPRRA